MYSKAPLLLILILTVITSLHSMLVSRDQVHHLSFQCNRTNPSPCQMYKLKLDQLPTPLAPNRLPRLPTLPPWDSCQITITGIVTPTGQLTSSDPSTPLSQAPSTTSTESEIMLMFTGSCVLPEHVLLFYYLDSSSWHYLIMRLFYCICPVALPWWQKRKTNFVCTKSLEELLHVSSQ